MTSDDSTVPELSTLRALDVDLDELLDVLSDRRRRFVLSRLATRAVPMAVADLAADLVRHERGTSDDGRSDAEVPGDRLEEYHIALHHVHVPKLAAAGIVEHDRERNTVELADGYDGVASHATLAAIE